MSRIDLVRSNGYCWESIAVQLPLCRSRTTCRRIIDWLKREEPRPIDLGMRGEMAGRTVPGVSQVRTGLQPQPDLAANVTPRAKTLPPALQRRWVCLACCDLGRAYTTLRWSV